MLPTDPRGGLHAGCSQPLRALAREYLGRKVRHRAIDADAVAHRPAEQHVDRLAQCLAQNVDVGGSYDLTEEAEVYFKVDNLFNHRAPPFGASSLYDVVGRMFRLGARFEF